MWFINALNAFPWGDRRKFLYVPDRDCTDKPKKVQPGEAVHLLGPLQEQEWLKGRGTSENPEAPSVLEGPPANHLPRVNSTGESHPTWLFTSYITWGATGSPERRVPTPPSPPSLSEGMLIGGISVGDCSSQTAKLSQTVRKQLQRKAFFLQTIPSFQSLNINLTSKSFSISMMSSVIFSPCFVPLWFYLRNLLSLCVQKISSRIFLLPVLHLEKRSISIRCWDLQDIGLGAHP